VSPGGTARCGTGRTGPAWRGGVGMTETFKGRVQLETWNALPLPGVPASPAQSTQGYRKYKDDMVWFWYKGPLWLRKGIEGDGPFGRGWALRYLAPLYGCLYLCLYLVPGGDNPKRDGPLERPLEAAPLGRTRT